MTRLVALGVLGFAFASGAYAQEEEQSSTGTVGENVGNAMNQAYELISADDFAGAEAVLSELRLDRLSPYERGRVEMMFSIIAYEGEDYDKARTHLTNAINSGGLNEQEISQARFQFAQFFLIEEKWAEAAAAFEEWFKTAVNPNSNAYYMLAVAYFQMEDFDRALAPAEKSVELMTEPNINWIQLLLAIYSERKEYAKAIPLLERLIVLQPEDKRWWVSLSMHHSLLEDNDLALAVMELADMAGLLKEESELMRMAELYNFNDVPYRCAQVISEGIEAGVIEPTEEIYERTADCWMRAREFEQAIPPLTRAAELAENGDQFVRLAEVQTQRQNWEGVRSAAERALEKGDLSEPGQANLLLGLALYNLEMRQEARAVLVRAAQSEKQRQMARGYIDMIDAGL